MESLDGWFLIEWDWRESTYNRHVGYLTYDVLDRDTGYRYVARYDDGWRLAPKGHETVDMEELIGNEVQAYNPDLEGLVMTLNLVSGKQV